MIRGWRALAVFVVGASAAARAQPVIRWVADSAAPAVVVDGLAATDLASLSAIATTPGQCGEVLAVFAEQPPSARAAATVPMAGSWRVADGQFRFEPRFPWARGVRYRAEFRAARLRDLPPRAGQGTDEHASTRGAAPLISYFELSRERDGPATTVVQIYPTGDVLPENQLKFYVHFSGAMSRGGIYDHVQLRDATGRVIELPFLELDEELWDPEMTRLTLLIDPGRIKRGVKPLEDIGPVFEEGQTYTLTIKPSWRDAAGRPLQAAFEKTFRAGPADRTPPDPRRWTFASVPRAGTVAPLVVRFDEPLDRALATRLIGVSRTASPAGGESPLPGDVFVDEQERRWSFRPAEPWRSGTHQLVVRSTIEDLAGNNIGKTFDVELAAGGPRQLAAPFVVVPFDVK